MEEALAAFREALERLAEASRRMADIPLAALVHQARAEGLSLGVVLHGVDCINQLTEAVEDFAASHRRN